MSLRLSITNRVLKLTVKRHLSRARVPARIRRRFEWDCWLFLRRPRGYWTKPTEFRFGEFRRPGLLAGANEGQDGVLLYLHGGAFIFGSPATHSRFAAAIAGPLNLTAALPDYRLAPEYPYPAAREDVLNAYRALLQKGCAPDRIVIAGDSSGGCLALGLLADILALDLPRPAGVAALSPITDLTFSGRSISENAESDVILPAAQNELVASYYLDGTDRADPGVSPLFADFTGAPPLFFQFSKSEILRDDSLRLIDRLRNEGLDIRQHVLDDAPHVAAMFNGRFPEADEALRNLMAFVAGCLTREV